MKNIIKPGNIKPKTKTIYEATCGNCGCKFEFDDEEIIKRTKSIDIHTTIWVECPCCGNELEIDNPKVVREEMEFEDFKIVHKEIGNKPEDIVDKINDIYALGKIVLMYADEPATCVSSNDIDNKISFNVDITATYNSQDFYNYYNLIYKIFRVNGQYRKELLEFINHNEQNKEKRK